MRLFALLLLSCDIFAMSFGQAMANEINQPGSYDKLIVELCTDPGNRGYGNMEAQEILIMMLEPNTVTVTDFSIEDINAMLPAAVMNNLTPEAQDKWLNLRSSIISGIDITGNNEWIMRFVLGDTIVDAMLDEKRQSIAESVGFDPIHRPLQLLDIKAAYDLSGHCYRIPKN